jgi:hypothetical protein
METLNKALAAKERNSSEELQCIKENQEALDLLNNVLTTKEIRSNNELQDVRKQLIDVNEQLVPSFFLHCHCD